MTSQVAVAAGKADGQELNVSATYEPQQLGQEYPLLLDSN